MRPQARAVGNIDGRRTGPKEREEQVLAAGRPGRAAGSLKLFLTSVGRVWRCPMSIFLSVPEMQTLFCKAVFHRISGNSDPLCVQM